MTQEKPTGKDWQTYLTLGLSALGITYFLFQTLTLAMVWLSSWISGQGTQMETLPIVLLMWSSLLSAAVLVPLFILTLLQLRGKAKPSWLDVGLNGLRKVILWVILAWPLIVFLGWLVVGRPTLAVFLLGPINLLVAGLPVLWVLNAAARKLDGGDQLRQWRIFGFSLTVMPSLVIVVELLAVVTLAVLGGIYLAYRMSVDPQLAERITSVLAQLEASGQDLDKIMQVVEPLLMQPSVIFWAAAIMGGVMPLIEEIVKPIGLWVLAGRRISPQEGFVGGLLCGAGFALAENVLYFTIALAPEDWLYMAIGRAGTGVLHMLASGLVGWGLAKTWREGRWGFQALTTLGAIVLHGLWNTLALAAGFVPQYLVGEEVSFWQTMLFNTPIFILLILSVFGMILINRNFCRRGGNSDNGEMETQLQEGAIVNGS